MLLKSSGSWNLGLLVSTWKPSQKSTASVRQFEMSSG